MRNKIDFEMTTNIVRAIAFIVAIIFYFTQIPGGRSSEISLKQVNTYFLTSPAITKKIDSYVKKLETAGGIKTVRNEKIINKDKLIKYLADEDSIKSEYAPFYNYKNIFNAGILALLYIITAIVLTKSLPYNPVFSIIFASVDFLLATLFIFWTGGIESPFIFMYILPVVHIATQIGFSYSLGVAALSAVIIFLCSNLLGFYGVEAIKDPFKSIIPFTALLGLSGFLVGTISRMLSPMSATHIVVDETPKRLEDITRKYQAQSKELQKYLNMEENFRRKQREFHGIHEIIQEIVSEVDIKKLLPLIMIKAAEECEARVGATLLKTTSGELRVYERYNLSPVSEQIFTSRYGEGVLGTVALKGEPVSLAKSDNDPRFSYFARCPERVQNILCVPMNNKGENKGVIIVCNKLTGDRFSDDDQRTLSILAGIAASAIATAELFIEIGNKNEELADAYTKLENSVEDTITTLAEALDAKDNYTREHSKRVCKYAVALAGDLGLNDEQIELIRRGALLHDIGKIGIPDRILFKPEGLTDDEFAIIKSHVTEGAKIIQKVDILSDLTEIVKYHHEKFDGTGYPGGLKGEKIPLGARIVAVSDTYDAMTTDKPYRKGFSPEVALEKMAKFAPAQVGMDIFMAFEKMMRKNSFFRM